MFRRFVLYNCLASLACFGLLRLTLAFRFPPDASVKWIDYVRCVAVGTFRDLLVSIIFTLPLLLGGMVFLRRWRGPWQRWFFTGIYFFAWTAFFFLLVAEYYFFEEFKSRFNTVAIDYLLYPHEVFVNIWEAYPVIPVLAGCFAGALVVILSFRQLLTTVYATPPHRRIVLGYLSIALMLVILLMSSLRFVPARFSHERLINELSNNGVISVTTAAWSHNLDYAAFFPVMPRAEAFARARQLLSSPGEEYIGPQDSLTRRVAGDFSRPRLNVVIFLEESLGSEFWGALGRRRTLTPELDHLSTEGLLFENIYATGNRTVRGFEGVLSSFPPLPGDSIVKRDHSENVETIARVLQRDGYRTLFVYGGRGAFDHMRSFTSRNGYERFIEQKDFSDPSFITAWGICNEDVYLRVLQECRELDRKGEPFLVTTLSVSNHKPYTYPAGRIAEDPREHHRSHAVKYTDWALGQFFAAAKEERFWTNTVFVVVADHGARVYGSQSIPIHSYEIPFLVLGPVVVKTPARLPQLGSQIDVAPTILGLVGRPYETTFFGHDLLKTSADHDRVLVNHNRDIGIAVRDHLVVMSLNRKMEYYHGDPKAGTLIPAAGPDAIDRELAKDATALFQTADDLYMHRNYRIQETRIVARTSRK